MGAHAQKLEPDGRHLQAIPPDARISIYDGVEPSPYLEPHTPSPPVLPETSIVTLEPSPAASLASQSKRCGTSCIAGMFIQNPSLHQESSQKLPYHCGHPRDAI